MYISIFNWWTAIITAKITETMWNIAYAANAKLKKMTAFTVENCHSQWLPLKPYLTVAVATCKLRTFELFTWNSVPHSQFIYSILTCWIFWKCNFQIDFTSQPHVEKRRRKYQSLNKEFSVHHVYVRIDKDVSFSPLCWR